MSALSPEKKHAALALACRMQGSYTADCDSFERGNDHASRMIARSILRGEEPEAWAIEELKQLPPKPTAQELTWARAASPRILDLQRQVEDLRFKAWKLFMLCKGAGIPVDPELKP